MQAIYGTVAEFSCAGRLGVGERRILSRAAGEDQAQESSRAGAASRAHGSEETEAPGSLCAPTGADFIVSSEMHKLPIAWQLTGPHPVPTLRGSCAKEIGGLE